MVADNIFIPGLVVSKFQHSKFLCSTHPQQLMWVSVKFSGTPFLITAVFHTSDSELGISFDPSINCLKTPVIRALEIWNQSWLVVSTPLKNISQLG
jgi:hypothetical protein